MTDPSTPVLIFLLGATIGAGTALYLRSRLHDQQFLRRSILRQRRGSDADLSPQLHPHVGSRTRLSVHVHNRNHSSTDVSASQNVVRGEERGERADVEGVEQTKELPRWLSVMMC